VTLSATDQRQPAITVCGLVCERGAEKHEMLPLKFWLYGRLETAE